jgi:Family of unknown function (DUF5709)
VGGVLGGAWALTRSGTRSGVTENSPEDAETYHDYSVDDEDQPSNLEDLGDPDVADQLDRGYAPPEKWSAAQGYGNTPYEEAAGESLDQRLAQEDEEPDPYEAAATGDEDVADGEVGDERAGRLVEPDAGLGEDTESDLVADDVGIDGAAASAEEAAVHVVPEEEGDL